MAELENVCCTPDAQARCCEPEDKADCCGPEHATCGCSPRRSEAATGSVGEADVRTWGASDPAA